MSGGDPMANTLDDFLYNMMLAQIRQQQGIPAEMPMADASKQARYDYEGFAKAAVAGDQRASTSMNASDNRLHFPDPWKAENHQTHKWKTQEDYMTQAKYRPLTDEEMRNSFDALSGQSPQYRKMIEMERTIPDYLGDQGRYTQMLYDLSSLGKAFK